MKKYIIYFNLISILFIFSCQTQNLNKIAGRYYCIPNKKLTSDSLLLVLYSTGNFEFIPKLINSESSYIKLCKKSIGTWKLSKNIILNSRLNKSINLIKSSENKCKDSILIKVINFSDSTPFKDYEFDIFNNKDSLFFIGKTNINGLIFIPSNGYKEIYFLDHIGQGKPIKSLNPKFNYTFIYYDCYPEYFNHEKFQIKGDTLIRTLKNNDKKYIEKYIKFIR